MDNEKKYDETNQGALFANNYKRTPRDPDYTGKMNYKGETFNVSAWKKNSKNGVVFIKMAVYDGQKSGEGKQRPEIPQWTKRKSPPPPQQRPDVPPQYRLSDDPIQDDVPF